MADTTTLSDNAIKLILQFEIGGSKKYYDRFLAKPSWPEGSSGVTIGIGVDLGYESEILDDLGDILTEDEVNRLRRVKGITGSRAKAALGGVKDITIPWDFALDYFKRVTLPKYIAQTLQAFPNSENLPDDAFGALVSLVFNRGPLVDNSERRKEMKKIQEILLNTDGGEIDAETVQAIARQFRSMARLWPDKASSDNDLHDRRYAEARLIDESI